MLWYNSAVYNSIQKIKPDGNKFMFIYCVSSEGTARFHAGGPPICSNPIPMMAVEG